MINQKTITGILSMTLFVVPVVSLAQVGIPCGDLTVPGGHECGFNDVIVLINNVVKFLMFSVAVPLAAIGFMFMGGKMVLLSDKEAEVTAAKKGIQYIVTGFGIMLVAYILIKTALFAIITEEQKSFIDFMFQ